MNHFIYCISALLRLVMDISTGKREKQTAEDHWTTAVLDIKVYFYFKQEI